MEAPLQPRRTRQGALRSTSLSATPLVERPDRTHLLRRAPSGSEARQKRQNGPMSELWQLGALELADVIRKQEATSRQVLDALLGRIDRVNGDLNAVVALLPEALAAAERADRVVASGEDGDRKSVV